MNIKIDTNELKWWCLATEDDIFELAKDYVVETSRGRYIHIDNGANVLVVAHADTVGLSSFFEQKGKYVFSPNLDDRLGCYIVWTLLRKLGVNVDVLITEGEESGWSTAAEFKTDKTYNWVAEFDRQGEDVVMYQYDEDGADWKGFLSTYGLKHGMGSFSDISDLEELGCKCFNFGIGYQAQHTTKCQANLKNCRRQIYKFIKMYNDQKDIHMPHEYVGRCAGWQTYGNWGSWDIGSMYGKFLNGKTGYKGSERSSGAGSENTYGAEESFSYGSHWEFDEGGGGWGDVDEKINREDTGEIRYLADEDEWIQCEPDKEWESNEFSTYEWEEATIAIECKNMKGLGTNSLELACIMMHKDKMYSLKKTKTSEELEFDVYICKDCGKDTYSSNEICWECRDSAAVIVECCICGGKTFNQDQVCMSCKGKLDAEENIACLR